MNHKFPIIPDSLEPSLSAAITFGSSSLDTANSLLKGIAALAHPAVGWQYMFCPIYWRCHKL